MKRLLTGLAVVLLVSIAYSTDAQADIAGFDGTWSGLTRCESLSGEPPFNPREVVVEIIGDQVKTIDALRLGDQLFAEILDQDLRIWGKYYWNTWKEIRFSGSLYNDHTRLTGIRGPRECVLTLIRQPTLKQGDQKKINSLEKHIALLETSLQKAEQTEQSNETKSLQIIDGLKEQITALETQVTEAEQVAATVQSDTTSLKKLLREAKQESEQVAATAQSDTTTTEQAYAQLEKDYQALQQAQQAAESQSQRAIDDLKGQITALETQVTEAEQVAATAQSAAMEAKNKQLLADLAALEKAHNKLRQQLDTLKVEYEPLSQEHEERLAAQRQRFEAQAAIAEQLASDVQAFMAQNPDLSQLISLLQLTRKLKTSITGERLEPLETSYNQLAAALEDIPGFAAFLEQQAKAEQAATEQKRKEAEAKLAAEKKQQEEARLAAEQKQQEQAARKRKAEEALIEKAQQLVLAMRQYLVKHMDADDIDDRLADLAVLEKAISSQDIGKIRPFVEASEAEARREEAERKRKAEEARLAAEKKQQEKAERKRKAEEARLAAEKKKQEEAERKRKAEEVRLAAEKKKQEETRLALEKREKQRRSQLEDMLRSVSNDVNVGLGLPTIIDDQIRWERTSVENGVFQYHYTMLGFSESEVTQSAEQFFKNYSANMKPMACQMFEDIRQVISDHFPWISDDFSTEFIFYGKYGKLFGKQTYSPNDC